MAPVLAGLAAQGLSLIVDAVMAKGKEVVEEKLGVKIPDDPKDLTPEKTAELAKAQMDHQEFLVNAALEETKAHLADRQDARARDVALAQANRKNLRGDVLAYGAVTSLVLVILLLFFVDVPRGSRDLMLVVLGSLMVIVKDVYGFEFGSSKDSARTQQTMSELLKNGNGS